jgi:hypothetical protein
MEVERQLLPVTIYVGLPGAMANPTGNQIGINEVNEQYAKRL